MTLFRENPELAVQQIDSIALKIQKDYEATNVIFLEQTEHCCKFKGYKDDRQYFYSFDKGSAFGYIVESEEVQ